MDKNDYISLIINHLRGPTIAGMKRKLIAPAGRQPLEENIVLSEWYNKLSEEDQEMLAKVIRKTTDLALFGFLCMLDGVSLIPGLDSEMGFELFFVGSKERVLLNDPEGEYLHDLFKDGIE